jgi:hypothetical protein
MSDDPQIPPPPAPDPAAPAAYTHGTSAYAVAQDKIDNDIDTIMEAAGYKVHHSGEPLVAPAVVTPAVVTQAAT